MSEYTERARAEAAAKIERIRTSVDPKIRYKDMRPITDIRDMFESSVRQYPDNTAFYVKDQVGGPYRPIAYREVKSDVDGLGTALLALDLKDQRVAIIGDNRYEWAVSYLAATGAACVVVPLDKELSSEELLNLTKESEAAAVIYSSKYEKVFREAKAAEGSCLKYLINMDAGEKEEERLPLKKLIEEGKKMIECGNAAYSQIEIDRERMSILLFTSGTTGIAKGVMLSHKNIAENLMVMVALVEIRSDDVFFSVLPIHHTYECTCGFLCPLYRGAAIAYCEGLRYIVKNLSEAKPTVFLAVPLIVENIYNKIWQQARKGGMEAKLKKILKINKKTKKFGIDLVPLLLKKVTSVFGGRLRLFICGGAAIDGAVLEGIREFGINALQGYGLTECSPICALNPDLDPKNDAAGYPPPEIEIMIAEKDENGIGEIITKGANVMMGYYKNPEETAKVLRDGWFYTGDLGYLDDDGYVHITGRKKNVIITKNGKNVFPEEIEFYLSRLDAIEECLVWGKDSEESGETLIFASIKPNEEVLKAQVGAEYTEEQAKAYLWREIDSVNGELPYFKRIKKIAVRSQEFEKTTAHKVKRFAEGNREVVE